jgi:hypothetical protein
MIFIDNKYTNTYYKIIAKAQDRVNQQYVEKHHIIPKSLGGPNTVENLVSLTFKEHFICHLLLTKMTTGNNKRKMISAFWAMSHLKNKHQERSISKVNCRLYEKLKEDYKKQRKSYKHSEETKKKISNSNKGKKLSIEHKKIISEHRVGVPTRLKGFFMSEETKLKISRARKGKSWGYNHSEETKNKMSEWQKGIPKPKFSCIYCNKEVSLMNLKRWHNNNCKKKP